MSTTPLVESALPLAELRRGKVRDVYAVDDETLLLVASDRVSAFDVILAEPIPKKGAVLTQMSAFWFRELATIITNHFITTNTGEIVERLPALGPYRNQIAGRATLVRRAEPILFECVVRGYLSGSAWKEYKEHGTLAGDALPEGLVESAKLDPPLFSPATKAQTGHDENITFAHLESALGRDMAARLRDVSLALYEAGRERAARRGIIIADTKFEVGLDRSGDLLLIDELLTPDSSRFWPADRYTPGRSQPSFDKQPLRDYLEGQKRHGEWNGNSPAPALPWEIVRAASVRYRDAYQRITGNALPDDA